VSRPPNQDRGDRKGRLNTLFEESVLASPRAPPRCGTGKVVRCVWSMGQAKARVATNRGWLALPARYAAARRHPLGRCLLRDSFSALRIGPTRCGRRVRAAWWAQAPHRLQSRREASGAWLLPPMPGAQRAPALTRRTPVCASQCPYRFHARLGTWPLAGLCQGSHLC
jgi:hypothetical protein